VAGSQTEAGAPLWPADCCPVPPENPAAEGCASGPGCSAETITEASKKRQTAGIFNECIFIAKLRCDGILYSSIRDMSQAPIRPAPSVAFFRSSHSTNRYLKISFNQTLSERYRDLDPWTIYACVPALRIRKRRPIVPLTETELPIGRWENSARLCAIDLPPPLRNPCCNALRTRFSVTESALMLSGTLWRWHAT
jgi:hypothetical protein